MNDFSQQPYRVLVVDDDASIRATYRHILQPPPSELGGLEALISGGAAVAETQLFQVVEADQGETAAEVQRQALAEGLRFPLAFIDMRMPPGWDGMRTAVKLREQDPSIYIVIATAFSDYDVNALQQALGHDVVLLRKPFNQEEVFQLARTLCQSWMTRQRLEAVTAEMEERARRDSIELDQRNDLQALLIEIISRFIQVNTVNDLDDAVNWSLARLGRAIDVDGCSLFRFDPARDCYTLSHTWQALGIQPLPASLQLISRADIAPAHARFLRGEVFQFERLDEPLPELATISRLLDGLYDRVLAVPLEIGGRLAGFLEIGTVRSSDILDPVLVRLLFTVGHAITSAQDALEARHKLSESQAMLERTERITHTGSWEWDAASDSVIWSAELFSIFRRDPAGRPPSFAEHEQLFDAESMRLLRTAVAACLADGTPYTLHLRAIRADGARLICEARGYPRFDAEQRITGLYGSLQDITELAVAEDELKKAQYIVSSTPDGIALLDENYRYLIVNQTYERYSGLSREAFIGRSIAEYLGQAAFEQQVKPRFDRCLQGEIIRYAEWFDFPTLGRRFFSVTYSPYKDEAGRVRGVVANSRDITELKLAEAALADSEARFRGIVENADEGIWQVDREWRTVYVNRRMEDMLACPPGTMLGRPIGDFMDAAGRELAAGLQKLREQGVRQTHEFRFVRADGGDLPVLLSATPSFDADGGFSGAIAMVTDISERIQQERALTATAEFVARPAVSNFCAELVRHVALTLGLDYVHIARLTPDGARVATEAAWLDGEPIANWSYDLAGTPCAEVLRQSRRCIVSDVQACYPEDADLRNIDAEGYVGEPIVSAAGEVLGLIVGASRAALKKPETIQANLRILAARSAAEWQRQQALRLLRDERDTTRTILQTVEAIIVALDSEGRITLINRKGCELLGYSEAELIGQDWFSFCLPDNPRVEEVRAVFRKALAADLLGSEYYENPVRTRSGEERLIAWHNSSIRDAGGAIIGGLSAGEDITERRYAERALRASDERFHTLFEQTDALAIQGYLADGEVVFWNHAAEKIYGYPAEEAIGGNLLDLIIPDEMRDEVSAAVRDMIETGRMAPPARLRLRHKNGRPVSVYSCHALVKGLDQPPVLFCMDIDMGELDQAQAALNVALTKYKTLFDAFPLGITVTDPLGGVLETNRAAERLLGVPTDIHRQRRIDSPEWRIVRGDGTPMPPEEFASTRALKDKRRVENVEKGIVQPNGEITWISVTADLLPLDGYGLVISYGDITERVRADQALREERAKLRFILDLAPIGIWMQDGSGKLSFVNQAFCQAMGIGEQAFLSAPHYAELIPEAFREQCLASDVKALSSVGVSDNHQRLPFVDGRVHDLRVIKAVQRDAHGAPMALIGLSLDISEELAQQRALRDSELKFHTMLDWTYDVEYWIAPDGGFVYLTPSVQRITGYAAERFLADPDLLDSLVHDEDRAEWARQTRLCRAEQTAGAVREFDARILHRDGRVIWVAQSCRPVFDADGGGMGWRVTLRDIGARKAAEQQIRHLAYYDSLTGLPNRRLLMDRLGHALAGVARGREYGALMILDLDHFKVLNDTLGHDVGDKLLVEVAQRMLACVRQQDTVARLGGDEYVVMLEDLGVDEAQAASQAETVAEKVRAALAMPYSLQASDHEYHSAASIGLTLFGGATGSDTAEGLLKQADVALYQAKDAGRNAIRFFNPTMQAAIDARTTMENALRRALQRGDLHLHYQPQVDRHGRLIGAEALLRWLPPEAQPIMPSDFIPVAEASGLILPIGKWVFDTACAELKTWESQPDMQALKLAVNVSARQFHQADFVQQIRDSLARSGADPRRLKLELTESAVLANVEESIQRMWELRQMGITFSLDDFGTGYSSLAYLKRLPLDQVKIDQSFIRDISSDPNDAAIVRAILAMSHSLSINVIAEGVETEAQRQFLIDNGCTDFQGFLFGKPLPMHRWKR